MLTSLLPGLREVRTPLAVGYLWLATAYLLLKGRIPVPGEAQGSWEAIYTLGSVTGPAGVVGLTSFVAYLLGSVLQVRVGEVVVTLLTHISTRSSQSRWLQRRFSPSLVAVPEISQRDLFEFVATDVRRIAREHRGVWDVDVAEARDRPGEAVTPQNLTGVLNADVLVSARILAVRLQIASEPLFLSFDRKQAEADFRSAVAFPLAVLLGTLALVDSNLLWAVLLLVPLVLAVQGLRRAREARAELFQAVTQGVIRAPVLEQVEDAARRRNAAHGAQAQEDGDPSGDYSVPDDQVLIYGNGDAGTGQLPRAQAAA